MANFTDISNFVLDQLYGYQDANEVKDNTLRLKAAFLVEHTWDNTSDTDLGKHTAGFCVESYLGTNSVSNAKLQDDCVDSAEIADAAIDQAHLANSSVGIAQLKYADNGTSTTSTSTIVVDLGALSGLHLVQIRSGIAGVIAYSDEIVSETGVTDYHAYKSLKTSGGTVYMSWRYHTSSPPYNLGDIENWGQFLYIHRKKSGEVISTWIGATPIWESDRNILGKNNILNMIYQPVNPWLHLRESIPSDEEIIMVDFRYYNDEVIFNKEQAVLNYIQRNKMEFLKDGLTLEQVENIERQQIIKRDVYNKKVNDSIAIIEDCIRSVHYTNRKIDKYTKDAGQRQLMKHYSNILHTKLINKYKKNVKKKTKWEALNDIYSLKRKSLIEDIHSGDIPAITADKELPMSERKKLPQMDKFKNQIKVYQINDYIDLEDNEVIKDIAEEEIKNLLKVEDPKINDEKMFFDLNKLK